MGIEGVDPDLPTVFEGWFFKTTWRKFLWILLLPGTYSLRPMITIPKKVTLSFLTKFSPTLTTSFLSLQVVLMDVVNWVLNLVVDVSIAYFWGWRSLGYFLLGTFFSTL